MQKTIKIKLLVNKEQNRLIQSTMKEYMRTVNDIVDDMVTFNEYGKLSSANIFAKLPSSLRCQCVLDAKSIFKKYCKTGKQPVLKKPIAIWNNQNYKVSNNSLFFPVLIEGKSKRLKIKAKIPEETLEILQNSKLGTLRITYKRHKLIAQIAVGIKENECAGNSAMGVDLGLKCPAVCNTSDGKVKFVGNGRKNKYIRRHHKTKRKKLGKAKKLNAIRKSQDKEQRIMKDIDHKLSRQIVRFAIENKVSEIRMEKLANIRKTAKTSRKNEKNLHTWSFYRLAQFIEYKAKLEGIKVIYVDPAYTSQICPSCGEKHKAKDRLFKCNCGYSNHRDLVGAINILKAPVASGKSLSA